MSDERPDPHGHDAFLRLYVEHQRSVFGYIYTMVPNHADAEDILSETSLVLWSKFTEFEPGTNFAAWACKIAHHKVLNHLKAKSTKQSQLSDAVIAKLADTRLAREPFGVRMREALQHCIGRLSKADARLIKACYGGARSMVQVAEEFARPVNSVYTSVHRIRRSLMECIERRLRVEEGDA
ncbi:MAG: sigma-70 family RNA polymerase sigma factor [Pirellulales bacterium]|nr:sigma-70 family RNA polymerase sigma factor [Pirellulales bacterium]